MSPKRFLDYSVKSNKTGVNKYYLFTNRDISYIIIIIYRDSKSLIILPSAIQPERYVKWVLNLSEKILE